MFLFLKEAFMKRITKVVEHNQDNPDKQKNVHLTYKKLNGRTVKRKILPLSIKGNVVVAHDHKRDAIRSFKIERIKHMEKAAIFGFGKKKEYAHDDQAYQYAIQHHVNTFNADAEAKGLKHRAKHIHDAGKDYIHVGEDRHEVVHNMGKDKPYPDHDAAILFKQASQFWSGFQKQASAWSHAAEIIGLGALAAPTVVEMTGKKVKEKHKNIAELTGLGILAAPAMHALLKG